MGDLPASLAYARVRALRLDTPPRPRPPRRQFEPVMPLPVLNQPETTLPYRTPQQALNDPRTVPYQARPTEQQIQQDRALERFARLHELNRNDVNTPPGTYFGQDTLEMTGAPALARGMDALAAGEPGRALPEVALGGASILGWGFGAHPTAPTRVPRLPRSLPERLPPRNHNEFPAETDFPWELHLPYEQRRMSRTQSPDVGASGAGPDAGQSGAGPLLPELGANDRGGLRRIGALGDGEFIDSAAGQGTMRAPQTMAEALDNSMSPLPTRGAGVADSYARSLQTYMQRGDWEGYSRTVRIAGEAGPVALVRTARALAESDPRFAARAGDFNSVNDLAAAEDFLTWVRRSNDPWFARQAERAQSAARRTQSPDGGASGAGNAPPPRPRPPRRTQ